MIKITKEDTFVPAHVVLCNAIFYMSLLYRKIAPTAPINVLVVTRSFFEIIRKFLQRIYTFSLSFYIFMFFLRI